ncbi:MFS transporter [Isoptericola variabilis]|uniref:Major facilitator superfamily MFS_1 n=1 Tax=Isoptericola variabilis (strain 225) TaxID=743718 RepID=F6FVZ4_ISOV2|nr:MFS transporter [Isoptericola variabilis]AEG44464.1 major facilitator superfamily MFS_1 [Isoptericola variabilis 225]TWH26623.1 Na+/melibiose symporter-like transporter [Isoptericola variabilis J7]
MAQTVPPTPAAVAALPYPEDVLPTEKAPRRVVVMMAVAQLALFIALMGPATVSLAVKIQSIVPQGEDVAALGMVTSVAAVMALVANPVAGRISDRTTSRWGRRRPWMVAGSLVFVAGMATIAAAPNVALVLVGWLLGQLGGNFVLAPMLATIADQVPRDQRGGVAANVGIMQSVGVLGATYVASWFTGNMFLLFVPSAVVAAICVLVYCWVLPDQQVQVRREPNGLLAFVRTFWVNPLQHPDFAFAWWSRFCVMLATFLFIVFRLFFLRDQVGLDVGEATSVIATGVLIYTVATVVAAKVGGWLSDRTGRRKVFVIVSTAVFAVGTYLLTHVSTVGQFYALEALLGAALGVYVAVDMALVVDVLPNADDSAKDLGVMNIANAAPQSVAGALGAILLGLGAGNNDNYPMLFLGAGVIALVGALVVLPIKKVR